MPIPGNLLTTAMAVMPTLMDIKKWQSDSVTIKVDYDKCKGHGDCADNCPAEVYEVEDGKAVPVDIDQCVECCTCVENCPEEAITPSSCQ